MEEQYEHQAKPQQPPLARITRRRSSLEQIVKEEQGGATLAPTAASPGRTTSRRMSASSVCTAEKSLSGRSRSDASSVNPATGDSHSKRRAVARQKSMPSMESASFSPPPRLPLWGHGSAPCLGFESLDDSPMEQELLQKDLETASLEGSVRAALEGSVGSIVSCLSKQSYLDEGRGNPNQMCLAVTLTESGELVVNVKEQEAKPRNRGRSVPRSSRTERAERDRSSSIRSKRTVTERGSSSIRGNRTAAEREGCARSSGSVRRSSRTEGYRERRSSSDPRLGSRAKAARSSSVRSNRTGTEREGSLRSQRTASVRKERERSISVNRSRHTERSRERRQTMSVRGHRSLPEGELQTSLLVEEVTAGCAGLDRQHSGSNSARKSIKGRRSTSARKLLNGRDSAMKENHTTRARKPPNRRASASGATGGNGGGAKSNHSTSDRKLLNRRASWATLTSSPPDSNGKQNRRTRLRFEKERSKRIGQRSLSMGSVKCLDLIQYQEEGRKLYLQKANSFSTSYLQAESKHANQETSSTAWWGDLVKDAQSSSPCLQSRSGQTKKTSGHGKTTQISSEDKPTYDWETHRTQATTPLATPPSPAELEPEEEAVSERQQEPATATSSSLTPFSDFIDYAQVTAEGLTREVASAIFYTEENLASPPSAAASAAIAA